MLNLSSDIVNISRVGQTTAKRLKKIGINTVHDLLFYFPFRYDDLRIITPIEKLTPGANFNIVGQIELIQNKRSHRRKMNITEALVNDDSDNIKVIWFNQPFIAKNLKVGDKVSLAGKVEGSAGELTIVSPVYEKISLSGPIHTQGLVPNYHLTANITQKQIRFLINQVINLSNQINDWMPVEVKNEQKLIDLSKAVTKIHFPKNFEDIETAKKRLAWNELFLIQIQSQIIKKEIQNSRAKPIKFFEEDTKRFVESLKFKLTDGQRKAAWEILKDLSNDRPMARMLEGDVGSGKTIVAVLAMLNTALNRMQSVLMAPTEILAKQHYFTICKLLANFNINIGLITSNEKKFTNIQYPISNIQKNSKIQMSKANSAEKYICGAKINSQQIIDNSQIIIGTHALIQENIKFNNLALVIIDEQHRFGVQQRQELLKKSGSQFMPHLLSMTATPIPRSLALALYGELDLSIIKEMPKDRKPVLTRIVPEEKREKAYDFIRGQIKNGRQVFVICPLIDLSDKLGVKSVKEEFIKLDKHIFPDLKIGLLHGQLKPKEKEDIMQKFMAGEIKILVSTSVVEVGVDVPNAAVIMIEGAERFGLAQLHQFRGRVGRSIFQSYCFLFSENESEKTVKRLKALENCFDGFTLAKIDLKFRGPGEIYGLAQKGFPELKIASLFDYELMKIAQEAAAKIINEDKKLNKWPLLKEKIKAMQANYHPE